jgi:DNA-directed RNA polymerase subunit RPC12/RpoP
MTARRIKPTRDEREAAADWIDCDDCGLPFIIRSKRKPDEVIRCPQCSRTAKRYLRRQSKGRRQHGEGQD